MSSDAATGDSAGEPHVHTGDDGSGGWERPEAARHAVETFAELVSLMHVFGDGASRTGLPNGIRTFVVPTPAPFLGLARTFVDECLDAPRVLPRVTSAVAPLHLAPRAADVEVDLAYHDAFEGGSLASIACDFVVAGIIVDALAAVAQALDWGAENGVCHRALSPSLVGRSRRGWCVTGLGLVDGFERTRWLAHQEHRASVHGISLTEKSPRFLESDPFLFRTASRAVHEDRVGFTRLLAWLVLREVAPDGRCRPRLTWADHARQGASDLVERFASETSPFLPQASLRRLADAALGSLAPMSLSATANVLETMFGRSCRVDARLVDEDDRDVDARFADEGERDGEV